MKLKEARALRDEIRGAGIHCTVPLAGGAPIGYAPVILTSSGPVKFKTVEEWDAYKRKRDIEQFQREHPPRSPIEAMIDKACGLDLINNPPFGTTETED